MTKYALFAAACGAALTALSAASAAQAGEVEIRNAVARVVVIPENRSDIQVSVDQGASGLPALEVTRRGSDVRIDGGLQRRINNCRSGEFVTNPTEMPRGVSAEVRGHGRIELADAPLIVIRTPMDVEIEADGAVWGAIGRTSSTHLSAGGCGDWTVASTTGSLSVGINGSGDVRSVTAQSLDLEINGSGGVSTGAGTSLDVSINGSGTATVASVDGRLDVAIHGSGNVQINSGRTSGLDAVVAGSGSVIFLGEAEAVDVTIVGSGDVFVKRVTGRVDRSVFGSGQLVIG